MSGSKKALVLTGGMVETKAEPRQARASEKTEIVNFRVTAEFRRKLRIMAANRGINLTELLIAAVDALAKADPREGDPQ